MDKYVAVPHLSLATSRFRASAQTKIIKAYEQAVAKYGKNFDSDYGWAAFHLNMKKEKPSFSDSKKLPVARKCARTTRWETTISMPE